MSEAKVLSVGMGQVAVAREGETLKSILGSCVGIGLLLQEKQIFGLAHCLLPESPADAEGQGARFVDQAVPYLLQHMEIERYDYKNLKAILIGGAYLLAANKYAPAKDNVGAKNVASALKALKRLGIEVVGEHVGLDYGRYLLIDGSTGEYEVHKINKLKTRSAE